MLMLQQDLLLQTATLVWMIWFTWFFLSLWMWLTTTNSLGKVFPSSDYQGMRPPLHHGLQSVQLLYFIGENMWNIWYGQCAYTLKETASHPLSNFWISTHSNSQRWFAVVCFSFTHCTHLSSVPGHLISWPHFSQRCLSPDLSLVFSCTSSLTLAYPLSIPRPC